MARILSYDFAAFPKRDSPELVVAALLEYVNGGKEHLICSYDRQDSSCFLWSNQDARLFIPYGSGSCILSHLHVRSLKLDVSGEFNLADLKDLPIESLDLRECGDITLGAPVALPLLRTVHIRSGQLDPADLRRWIQTAENLEIIEITPDS